MSPRRLFLSHARFLTIMIIDIIYTLGRTILPRQRSSPPAARLHARDLQAWPLREPPAAVVFLWSALPPSHIEAREENGPKCLISRARYRGPCCKSRGHRCASARNRQPFEEPELPSKRQKVLLRIDAFMFDRRTKPLTSKIHFRGIARPPWSVF
jgi:hypothetical protein